MLCALTIRTLKPGTFEQFREAFMRHEDLEHPPAGYVCFGFFDGSVDELRSTIDERGYAEQLAAIDPFVDSVGADGLYEIVEEFTVPPGTADRPAA